MITNQKDAKGADAVVATLISIAPATVATVMEMGFAVNVVVVAAIVEVVIAGKSKCTHALRVNLGKPSLPRAARDGDAAVAGKFG